MKKGLRSARPADAGPLLELHAIRVLALVDDSPGSRLAALQERINELILGTRDDLLRQLGPYAFGTYTSERLPLLTRLQHARERGIGKSVQTLRKTYLAELAGDFADRLLWLEHRLRYNNWLERPTDETLHDELLRQYDFYTAMAFWLNGAALDLEAALEDHRARDQRGFRGFADSALWRYTRYLRFAYRYDMAFLGEWAFARNVDIDIGEVVRCASDAEALPPFTPGERSALRVTLAEKTFQEELAPFISLLERQEAGRTFLSMWYDWLKTCDCSPEVDAKRCRVHRFLEAASSFFAMMNQAISANHRTDRAARFLTLPDIYEP